MLHTLATREEMEMMALVSNLKGQMQEVATIFSDTEETSKVYYPGLSCPLHKLPPLSPSPA